MVDSQVVLTALVAVASAAPGAYLAGHGLAYSGLAHAAYAPAITYSNLNAAVPAPLPDNGLSPGLDALVKKTAITAAGRPVTRINTHVTRVEPEITHTKVDVAVPVARPVAVRRPVPVAVPYKVTPVVETTEVVQPVISHAVTAVRSAPLAPAHFGYSAGYAGLAHHGALYNAW